MDFKEWWKEESLNTFDYPSEAAEAGFEAGQQSKQAEIKRAVLSLRNEFNLWADDNEQFHAIEAQIEQLEELLK